MTYTVAVGDTLAKIAQRFLGDPLRYKELATLNNISNPNLIKVGQVIVIPSQTKSGVPTVPTPLIPTTPLVPTPLLPVPVTATPRVAPVEVIPSAPATGGSFFQNLLGNKKLLIALAVGAGLFFYMRSKKTSRQTAMG